MRENFRDLLANQDLDGDGVITEDESSETLRRALIGFDREGNFIAGTVGDSPLNYGAPREIRFGVQFRF